MEALAPPAILPPHSPSEFVNRFGILEREDVPTTTVESASVETCHCGCITKEIEELMLCAECDTNDVISDDDWNHLMPSVIKSDPKGASGVVGIMEPTISNTMEPTTYTKPDGNIITPDKRLSGDLDPFE